MKLRLCKYDVLYVADETVMQVVKEPGKMVLLKRLHVAISYQW